MQPLTTSRPWHRWGLIALIVVLAHLWVVDELAHRIHAFMGSVDSPSVQRMDVAFVRELEQQAPSAVAPVLAPQPARSTAVVAKPRKDIKQARAPERAASAVDGGEAQGIRETSQPRDADLLARALAQVAAQAAPDTPQPAASAASASVASVASAASATAEVVATASRAADEASPSKAIEGQPPSQGPASASSSERPSFEWPPSTRLSFSLTGNYRGPIEGTARVQWIRRDLRYQVQMDVFVGPEIAPLMWRRMTSDGTLTERGLTPRRYDEETRVAFASRRVALQFESDRVVLTNGQERPLPPGVQDSASQFVQLSYLFTLDPTLLTPGRSVTLPVALPRRLDAWVYDVVEDVVLSTRMGDIRAFHVRPRRESPRPGELVAQAWYAPSLQYLPVRILIRQDGDTFVDLLLNDKPVQAAPGS